MAIHPTYLAALRRQQRCELTLLMVQLEQVIPNWWASLNDLADQLGSERATLNKALLTLDKKGLIARASLSNVGGTWIWWVKRHPGDQPSPELEPCWKLYDYRLKTSVRITIPERQQWAKRNGIPWATMRGFLCGRQIKLDGRWVIRSTPMDSVCQSSMITRSAA